MTHGPHTPIEHRLVRTVVSWGRLTSAALLAVVVVLVALVVVDRWFYGRREADRLQAIEALRELHESMTDQQVGLRGFLLSHDEVFLQALEHTAAALASERARADRQTRHIEAHTRRRATCWPWPVRWQGRSPCATPC